MKKASKQTKKIIKQLNMEINDLPNVSKYWTKNGYLNFELITGDWIRLNFNNIQALKEQLTIHDVVGSTCKKEFILDVLEKRRKQAFDNAFHNFENQELLEAIDIINRLLPPS